MYVPIENLYVLCEELGMEITSEIKHQYSLHESFQVRDMFGREFHMSYMELCQTKFNMLNYIYA